MPLFLVSLVLLILSTGISAEAELTPDQVVVLANKSSDDGLAVARQYVARRGIPPSHLVTVNVPTDETVSREIYTTQIVRPLRETLTKLGLAAKARVLVTTYGIPLRVQAPATTSQENKWIADAEERSKLARFVVEQSRDRVARIAPAGTAPAGTKPPPPAGGDSFEALVQEVTQALRDAGNRVQSQREKVSPAQIDQWTKELATVAAQL